MSSQTSLNPLKVSRTKRVTPSMIRAREMVASGSDTRSAAEACHVRLWNLNTWAKKAGFKDCITLKSSNLPRNPSPRMERSIELLRRGNNTWRVAEETGITLSYLNDWARENGLSRLVRRRPAQRAVPIYNPDKKIYP